MSVFYYVHITEALSNYRRGHTAIYGETENPTKALLEMFTWTPKCRRIWPKDISYSSPFDFCAMYFPPSVIPRASNTSLFRYIIWKTVIAWGFCYQPFPSLSLGLSTRSSLPLTNVLTAAIPRFCLPL